MAGFMTCLVSKHRMSTTKRGWALEPCPEEAPKRQRYPGHSKEAVRSPTKKSGASRQSTKTRPKRRPAKSPAHADTQQPALTAPASQDFASSPAVETSAAGFEIEESLAASGAAEMEDAFDDFVQLVEEQYITFVQVTTFLYVVQGFDCGLRIGTPAYYHLEARLNGERDVRLSCLCPEGKTRDCFHKRFYREFREERFQMNEIAVKAGKFCPWLSQYLSLKLVAVVEGAVVLFLRHMIGTEDETWINRFSVSYGSHSDAIRSRCIVSYEGLDVGGGKWSCTKCTGYQCAHIRKANRLLNVIVGNSDEIVEEDREEMGEDELHNMYMVESVNTGAIDESAVSYQPVLPPEWASLPEDPQLYPRPSPDRPLPYLLPLDAASRSACGKHFYDPSQPTIEKECTIYTLIGHQKHSIGLQPCPTCSAARKCFIGPDPRTLGVFNLNNSVLFTHELLDDYTNRYTGSETPLASFVVSMARIYAGRNDKFVGEDLFRAAWFAFASIQHMEGDMQCPKCGVAPDTVIFDGVTTGFAKRHLRETLSPPTSIPDNPLVRHRSRHPNLQWLPGSASKGVCTRERLASWVKKWGERVLGQGPDRQQRIEELSALEKDLIAMEAAPLANMLRVLYGGNTELRDARMRRHFRVVFEQLSANESAMQMVNELGLHSLRCFVESPTIANASLLQDIPAVMLVAEQATRTGLYIEQIVALCRWMLQRGEVVLSVLKQGGHENLEEVRNSKANCENWKDVRQLTT
ncbi:hypothetical protein VNI00_010496 [Paramarasmius palmivorus]|uniref:HMG domain-containing protein n=1 Tax=Paramarasmius palmivorus TaxID=297713 RepID=A0AAW0CKR1_9AGAR